MVADPKQLEAVQQLLSLGAARSEEESPRFRSQRLVSAATMAAARSKCNCDACKYLRRAVDISIEEAKKELEPDAKGDDSKA